MVTLSMIKAVAGGWAGHTAVHPAMLEEAARAIDGVRGGVLIDGQVAACGAICSTAARWRPMDREVEGTGGPNGADAAGETVTAGSGA